MTTLGTLKSRIADDLGGRTDLGTQIGEAIADAITFFQSERFYFTETRAVTFSTVAAQAEYTSADSASIPKMRAIDDIFLTAGGRIYPASQVCPDEMELFQNTSATGQPSLYAFYAQSLWFYPIPGDAYTVRLRGVIAKDAPADDDEAGNVWMTEAFELIRCKAKEHLALHVTRDPVLIQEAKSGIGMALQELRARTSKLAGTGRLAPTSF